MTLAEVVEAAPETAADEVLIRQSTIESMQLCPAKVGYHSHPDYDPTPSQEMSFGSLVHELIAMHLSSDGCACDEFIPGELHDHAKEIVLNADVLEVWRVVAERDGFDLHAMADDRSLETWSLEARDAYEAWVETVWPQIKGAHAREPLAVEEQWTAPIGFTKSGKRITLQGTGDLLMPGELHDWKTTGQSRLDEAKYISRPQGLLYAHLALVNRDVQVGQMVYWVWLRPKGEWLPVVQTITAEAVKASLDAAREWAEMIEHQVFPPTPCASTGKSGRAWYCSARYCNAWNLCSFKSMVPDGVDLTEKRKTTWV